MPRTELVHLLTLGCPKNEADSRAMRDRLLAAGLEVAETPEDASVLVINTCSFLEAAAEESLDVILDAASSWKPESEGRRIVVAGCLPARYGDELPHELPEVDAFVPVADEETIADVVRGLTGGGAGAEPSRLHGAGHYEYVTVCDGCDRQCSFCTIPFIRGPFRSRPLVDIVAESQRLVAAGARELVLVGQDVSSYSSDGDDLAALVESLGDIDGLGWLRLMYVQPDGVTDRLLESMATGERVCRYLDLPLQHASREVLRRMGRRGDAESHLSLLERIRSALPGVALRTTLITGFPGETEDDFDELERFVAEAELDHVGVFAYSPEEGTPAADLPHRVAEELALDRARAVRETADDVSLHRFRRLAGSTLDVLIDGAEDGLAVGRWYGQAPEVDGVVRLDRSIPIGTFVRARIDDAVGHDLIGTMETQ